MAERRRAGKAKPVVSERWGVVSAQDSADALCEYIPAGAVDFGDPRIRAWFRDLLATWLIGVLRQAADDFGRAATRGMEQAAALMGDEGYYERQRERRKANRARYRRTPEPPAPPAFAEADRLLREIFPDGIDWTTRGPEA